jgi:hypothetical protein
MGRTRLLDIRGWKSNHLTFSAANIRIIFGITKKKIQKKLKRCKNSVLAGQKTAFSVLSVVVAGLQSLRVS